MATKNDPVKPKVQTTKAVTVSNKPKKKGPVAKMGELETRFRASMYKLAEDGFGFSKDMRTPHMQRILNKDARIYNKKAKAEKMQEAKDNVIRAKNKSKVEKLQEKGYSKSGFKTGGMVNSNAKVVASKIAKGRVGGISSAPKTAVPKAKMGMSMKRKSC
jgi:hypothetical protein